MKIEIFKLILDQINQLPPNKPILIAIDGVDGSGKSCFSNELVPFLVDENVDVLHSSIDHFHNPREERYIENKPIHVSFYENSFNYEKLKEVLLNPLKFGTKNTCTLNYFNHRTNAQTDTQPIPFNNNTVLIFDGIFNHRKELIDYWDFSIFLDVSFDETYRRMAIRDNCPHDPEDKSNERYYLGQKLYLNEVNPLTKASLIVNNNNYQNPKLI